MITQSLLISKSPATKQPLACMWKFFFFVLTHDALFKIKKKKTTLLTIAFSRSSHRLAHVPVLPLNRGRCFLTSRFAEAIKIKVPWSEVKISRLINWSKANVGRELTTCVIPWLNPESLLFTCTPTRTLEPETLAGRLGGSCWLQWSPRPLKFRWKKGVTQ